ncbi:MAG TPA: ferritin-like domain-containing protein [Acidimicrobiales bacterium]|nr:ferritin-like domain-containing protein [Acidimicrobiales bacterium]
MAASSGSLHESTEVLSPELVDRHRAIVSIMEELEAIDWYDQRVAAASDPELAGILAHNRDEEKEHAAMTLEWLRRRDPALDQQLRTYLFSALPVLEVESSTAEPAGATSPAPDGAGSLGIGGLKSSSREATL